MSRGRKSGRREGRRGQLIYTDNKEYYNYYYSSLADHVQPVLVA